MQKKIYQMIFALLAITMMSGCALVNAFLAGNTPNKEGNGLPSLMVQRIDVSINPWNPEFERHYQTQENLNATLSMLRDMETSDLPEEEPELSDEQTYYTITATYSTGEQQTYYILDHRYLKVGDEPWCEISYEDAMNFTVFIQKHKSDDSSYVPPASKPPVEATFPTETETFPDETASQTA